MILACTSCHHEVQAVDLVACDWCGDPMIQIATDYTDGGGSAGSDEEVEG